MNGNGTRSLSPSSVLFMGLVLVLKDVKKDTQRWREEARWMGGAPASFLRIRVGGFHGNRHQ